MTRIPLSDAQLDAEAAAPVRDLDSLIALHRHLFRDDLYIERLHVSSGEPVDEDPHHASRRTNGHGLLGATGLPFSAHFGRYIAAEYGLIFPWTRSYYAMRQACRRTHTRGHLERSEWDGSLCGALVTYVIQREYGFQRAVYDLYLTTDRAERVLRSALAAIEQRMDALQARQHGVSYGGSWPREPEWRHHALDGLHRLECPQCRRVVA